MSDCKICDGNGKIKGEKCIVCGGIEASTSTSKRVYEVLLTYRYTEESRARAEVELKAAKVSDDMKKRVLDVLESRPILYNNVVYYANSFYEAAQYAVKDYRSRGYEVLVAQPYDGNYKSWRHK